MASDIPCFKRPAWAEATPGFVRKLLRGALIDGALVLVLLVAGELLLRTAGAGASALIFAKDVTGGNSIVLNERGLREADFPVAKPAGQVRVLCLGNSTTFGTGVAQDATYAKQLEALLNDQAGDDRYFVINAGGQGNAVSEAIEFCRREGLSYHPDAVVFGYSPSLQAVTRQEGAKEVPKTAPRQGLAQRAKRAVARLMLTVHRNLHRSYLYAWLDHNVRKRFYQLGILQDRLDRGSGAVFAYAFDAPGVDVEEVEYSYSVTRDEIDVLHQILEAKGIPLVVLLIPSRFEISASRTDNLRRFPLHRVRIDPLDRVQGYCTALGVPVVDLRPPLRTLRRAMFEGQSPWDDLYTIGDYTHLDRQGHQVAAQQLRDLLVGHGLIPPPTATEPAPAEPAPTAP